MKNLEYENKLKLGKKSNNVNHASETASDIMSKYCVSRIFVLVIAKKYMFMIEFL